MPVGPAVPPEAITAARDAIANIRDRGATSIDLARAALEAAAPHLAAAHEHIWVRCEQCMTPDQPCACAGGICCEAQRREIEEFNEGHARGVAAERERCAQLADEKRAGYIVLNQEVGAEWHPLATLLREDQP